jgi:hypothetical protein
MRNHIAWGHAGIALYTLHTPERAAEELLGQEHPHGPFVLGLWNENGDGLALQGTRRELLDYLGLVTAHVQRETDPRCELDQALKRLHGLRQERSAAVDTANYSTGHVARLDEQEVDLLNDVAEAAEHVNDQL